MNTEKIYSNETNNVELQKFINYLRGIDQVNSTISLPEFIEHNIVDKLNILSPIRSLAKVARTNHDHLDIVVDQNESAISGWVTDTALEETKIGTLSKVSIYLHQLYARPKVPYSFIEDQSTKVEELLKDKITSQMASAENYAFLYGDGITQPHGILKYDIVSENYASKLKAIEAIKYKNQLDASVLIRTIETLKSKYLYSAVWLMSRNVAVTLRNLKDKTSDKFIWQNSIISGTPDTLLGYPVIICDDMPKANNKGAQIIFGNFYEGYQIVEQPNITLLKDPFNSKPFVEFYATKRVGGDVTDFNAFKVISLE